MHENVSAAAQHLKSATAALSIGYLYLEVFLDKSRGESGAEALFEQPLDILTIGLDGFTEELTTQGIQVMQLDWRPPAQGDAELAELLSKLGS